MRTAIRETSRAAYQDMRDTGLLGQDGRLVAILPSGARNSFTLPGFSLQWHGPFDNQFPGASVSVVILVAERQS